MVFFRFEPSVWACHITTGAVDSIYGPSSGLEPQNHDGVTEVPQHVPAACCLGRLLLGCANSMGARVG